MFGRRFRKVVKLFLLVSVSLLIVLDVCEDQLRKRTWDRTYITSKLAEKVASIGSDKVSNDSGWSGVSSTPTTHENPAIEYGGAFEGQMDQTYVAPQLDTTIETEGMMDQPTNQNMSNNESQNMDAAIALETGINQHTDMNTSNVIDPNLGTTTSTDFYKDHLIKRSDMPRPFTQNGPDVSYTNLLDVKPPNFLKNFRNPCWVEELHAADPYHGYAFFSAVSIVESQKTMKAIWAHRMKVGQPWRVRCLPYFYIAGMSKCGTADMYNKLTFHPNIVKSSFREPHFWTRWRAGWTPRGFVPISTYVDAFDELADKIDREIEPRGSGPENFHPTIFGEGSMTTFHENAWWDKLPENANGTSAKYSVADYIKHVTPHAKFIVMFRNPVDRCYSDYMFFRWRATKTRELFHSRLVESLQLMNQCLEENTLESCAENVTLYREMPVNIIEGLYVVFLKRWVKTFPMDQIKIVRLEDYTQDPVSWLNEVVQFLGLDSFSMSAESWARDAQVRTIENKKNRTETVIPMLDSSRHLLEDFYKPFNEALAYLLKDDKYKWEDN